MAEALGVVKSGRLRATNLRFLADSYGDDLPKARELYSEAKSIAEQTEYFSASATVRYAESLTEYNAGNVETAIALISQSLSNFTQVRTVHLLRGAGNFTLARYLLAVGCFDEARLHANESLAVGRKLDEMALVALSLAAIAVVKGHSGEYLNAALLWMFCDVRLRALDPIEERDGAKGWRFVSYYSLGGNPVPTVLALRSTRQFR